MNADSDSCDTPEVEWFARSDDLTIDPSTLELGSSFSKPAQEITESFNRFGGAHVGTWRVHGEVIAIHHGTYHQRPAVFLAFRFRYSRKLSASERIVRANVEIQFLPESRTSVERPIIVDNMFRPRELTVQEAPAHVKKSRGIEHGFSIMPGQPPLQF